jgi:hypothetical protein
MGDLYIEKPNGESLTILRDGTEIREMREPIQLDWCDKCEQWKELSGGHYLQTEGIKMIWFCKECK